MISPNQIKVECGIQTAYGYFIVKKVLLPSFLYGLAKHLPIFNIGMKSQQLNSHKYIQDA